MLVTIFGPNLNDQRKGTFHVHAADCADSRHYGHGRKYGGEEGWTIGVQSRLDVVEEVYADQLNEQSEGRESVKEDYLSDFHFAPCVKGLPHGQRKPITDD